MPVYKTFNCINCGKLNEKKPNTSGKYCDNKCQQDFQSKQILESWKKDHKKGIGANFRLKTPIRKFIFDKFDNKCCQCGWCEVNKNSNCIPLEIDHIDGDCLNNKEENLRLLCPNCHSLTSTYKALNRGKGNKSRLKYYKLI